MWGSLGGARYDIPISDMRAIDYFALARIDEAWKIVERMDALVSEKRQPDAVIGQHRSCAMRLAGA